MTQKKQMTPILFKFRSTDSIGSADADEDDYLKSCFVNTGILSVLSDPKDGRRIIVGRTGSGKTALIKKITEDHERVIIVPPETLALSYISNSTILRFLDQLGVKLDIFYKLLWRHVFAVELIRAHLKVEPEETKDSIFKKLMSLLGDKTDKKHEQALEYLKKWGSSFWKETDYRIRELTSKIENELSASIGAKIPALESRVAGKVQFSEEEKSEIIHRAQEIVNHVQIQELSNIIDLIDRILDDPQKVYYILVDRLDEQWVDDQIRYQLIRALIETVREFKRIHNAKVIIAMRRDLLDRVFRFTRDAGFQEEKYESLYLNLIWTPAELAEVLDTRISELVRSRYTTQVVTHVELLPDRYKKRPILDYIFSLTMMRPRDVIIYFNTCLEKATNRSTISETLLSQIEGEYSRKRLRSLADEWHSDYPTLLFFADVLKTKTATFQFEELGELELNDLLVKLIEQPLNDKDPLSLLSKQVLEGVTSVDHLRRELISIFYRVGLIGLRNEKSDAISWAYMGQKEISATEISMGSRVTVHHCFRRALGIKEDHKTGK